MPFQKGDRANPGGRPKQDTILKSQARKHALAAIEKLAGIVNDEDAPHAARVSAANSLLDRGYGKPAQALIHQGDEDKPMRMQLTDFYAGIATTLNGAHPQPGPEGLLANGHDANGAPGKEPGPEGGAK